MKVSVLAIGKLRGYENDLGQEYLKRLSGSLTLKEIAVPKSALDDNRKVEEGLTLKALQENDFLILLDERGENLSSRELASKMSHWLTQGGRPMVFLIGGASGVSEKIRKRANFTLGFGRATWPHRLVRVMLLEQLYRAHQINIGHPYHRD